MAGSSPAMMFSRRGKRTLSPPILMLSEVEAWPEQRRLWLSFDFAQDEDAGRQDDEPPLRYFASLNGYSICCSNDFGKCGSSTPKLSGSLPSGM